jgi:adenosylcobinamide amidohydrolase
MTQLVTCREESSGLWVECLTTVGVTNAVRAGTSAVSARCSSDVQNVGTINTIVIINAVLTQSAMVGAVQVVTESKTGTLRDHDVPSWSGEPGATGTGTDAVVIACAQRGKGPMLAYSGTHTEIGSMIGRVVAACIAQGLVLARQ